MHRCIYVAVRAPGRMRLLAHLQKQIMETVHIRAACWSSSESTDSRINTKKKRKIRGLLIRSVYLQLNSSILIITIFWRGGGMGSLHMEGVRSQSEEGELHLSIC